MSKTVDILTALRTRLTDAGFTVFLGRVVDPKHDDLPIVALLYHEEGEQTVSTRPRPRKSLDLVAELWVRTRTDDPVLELVPLGEQLEDTLIQPISDGTDRLGGLATDVEHQKTVLLALHDYNDVGLAQVAIRVNFVKG